MSRKVVSASALPTKIPFTFFLCTWLFIKVYEFGDFTKGIYFCVLILVIISCIVQAVSEDEVDIFYSKEFKN